jgi:vesicle-associated membrane protein 4
LIGSLGNRTIIQFNHIVVDLFDNILMKSSVSSVSDGTEKKYNTMYPRDEKLDKIKSGLDDVVITMKDNIVKVLERGEKIDATLVKTEALTEHSETWLNSTKRLRRRMYLQNIMKKCLIFSSVMLILTAIVCWIYFDTK